MVVSRRDRLTGIAEANRPTASLVPTIYSRAWASTSRASNHYISLCFWGVLPGPMLGGHWYSNDRSGFRSSDAASVLGPEPPEEEPLDDLAELLLGSLGGAGGWGHVRGHREDGAGPAPSNQPERSGQCRPLRRPSELTGA
jgi:hypothetical protein